MRQRLVTAEINLSHFAHNFAAIRSLVGPNVAIVAMVKGNAYGHGDVAIAKAAVKLGASLGVACLYEAARLRQAGIKAPILLVGYNDPEIFPAVLDLNLQVNVMDEPSLKYLEKLAQKKGKVAKIHVKIDTGMHRLGISPEEAREFIPQIENYKNIQLAGIYSHFASADEKDLSFTQEQLQRFLQLKQQLKRQTAYHIANSAALLRLPQTHLDMVRPGKILYGIPPSLDFPMPFLPKPILSLKTQIVQIRRLKKGDTVGYGRTFTAPKEVLVATLPVGYGDGFRRSPSNWERVLVHGQFAPVIGRVSMDQSSLDVSAIPGVKPGDPVVLIGKQQGKEITAYDVAAALGTSSYEVITSLSSRVTRKYII